MSLNLRLVRVLAFRRLQSVCDLGYCHMRYQSQNHWQATLDSWSTGSIHCILSFINWCSLQMFIDITANGVKLPIIVNSHYLGLEKPQSIIIIIIKIYSGSHNETVISCIMLHVYVGTIGNEELHAGGPWQVIVPDGDRLENAGQTLLPQLLLCIDFLSRSYNACGLWTASFSSVRIHDFQAPAEQKPLDQSIWNFAYSIMSVESIG